MRKLNLVICLTALVMVLCSCGAEKVDTAKLIEDASLAREHKEYDVAAGYYEQVLDADSSVLEARYGLEELFALSLNYKDYDLAQSIYSYVYNLNSDDVSLTKFQDKIIEYDNGVLNGISPGLEDAFLRSSDYEIKELSNIDMELYDFIAQSGADYKDELDYYGLTDDELEKEISRLIYFDENGNITFDKHEVHIAITCARYDGREMLWDVALYLEGTDHRVYTGELPDSLSDFDSTLPEEAASELTLIYFDDHDPDYALTSKGYAYDNTGDYYVLMNNNIPIPEQLWGAVLYNQTDGEYYAVVQSGSSGSPYPVGAIKISASEADELVELSRKNDFWAVVDYFGYSDKYWCLEADDDRGEYWEIYDADGNMRGVTIKGDLIYDMDGYVIGEIRDDDFYFY